MTSLVVRVCTLGVGNGNFNSRRSLFLSPFCLSITGPESETCEARFSVTASFIRRKRRWYSALSVGDAAMEEAKPTITVRFGVFEVDLQAGELRRQGVRVKLQEQPFQLLVMLLERPGQSVTREELQKKLWPADTFVDFERGLNRAVNKLREALGDDADSPRFVETLPRRGYRFIVPVETAGTQDVQPSGKNRLVLVPSDSPYKGEDSVSETASPRRWVVSLAAAGLLAAIAVGGYWRPWSASRIEAGRPFQQFELEVGPDEFRQPAISPDGMRIVFVSNGALALRRLDQAKTSRLPGTEGAGWPFFSPNGQSVAFFANGKLQRLDLGGGTPVTLCPAARAGGGTWVDGGTIVAVLDESLYRIPATGGEPQPLTNAKVVSPDIRMTFGPQVLPGSKRVLFTAINGSDQGSLRILNLEDGKITTVVENATRGRYLTGGYLIYDQQETLFAAPMDQGRLELTGRPVPLVSGVSRTGSFDSVQFDLSGSGTLVYRGGAEAEFALCWLYPSGRAERVLPKPGRYSTPKLSPDGSRLAIPIVREGRQNLWIHDFSRQTWTRLTSDAGPDLLATWTPDGEFIAFRSGNSLAWTRSDGSGKVEHMTGVSANAGPNSFAPDGKWLAFWPLEPNSDLWIVPVERTPGSMRLGQPQPLLQQPGSKGAPAISPDGRWVAYTSSESGRFEIYVMPLSPQRQAEGAKWTVSNEGGVAPIWSPNGRGLFYQGFDCRIHVVEYTVKGSSFVAEKPRIWSPTRLGDTGIFPAFDVAPDGKRVLALLDAGDPKPETLIHVLLNVDSEVGRRIAAQRN